MTLATSPHCNSSLDVSDGYFRFLVPTRTVTEAALAFVPFVPDVPELLPPDLPFLLAFDEAVAFPPPLLLADDVRTRLPFRPSDSTWPPEVR